MAESTCDDIYTRGLRILRNQGMSIEDAAAVICHRYLDGKPRNAGKRKISRSLRDRVFWTAQWWSEVPDSFFVTEVFALALSRYFQQEQVSATDLLRRVFEVYPDVVGRAVRYSQLFLRPDSHRWREVQDLASRGNPEFIDFLRACRILAEQDRSLLAEVEGAQELLGELSVLELLIYASLVAFKTYLPIWRRLVALGPGDPQPAAVYQSFIEAIGEILTRKLRNSSENDFRLNDQRISAVFQDNLRPFLALSNNEGHKARRRLARFERLVELQRRLDRFRSQDLSWFCFDDDYRIRFEGDRLILYPREIPQRSDWDKNAEKYEHLHRYWRQRSMVTLPYTAFWEQTFGHPEHDALNREAWISVDRDMAMLHDLYGLERKVALGNGESIDLTQACLALEMTGVYFRQKVETPYCRALAATGDWNLALTETIFAGFAEGMENRFPLSFSDRREKVQRMRPYTQDAQNPNGSLPATKRIMEFWTTDLKALAADLKNGKPMPPLRLWERPFLRIGRYVFQAPWLLAFQNNAIAVINCLRRHGANRSQRLTETHRIEERFAVALAERGFRTIVGYHPEDEGPEPVGEVDVIAACENCLFVFEIKSSYIRLKQREAWLHRINTLRKAGRQLRRKRDAVLILLQRDPELRKRLGFMAKSDGSRVYAWIVDTSVEHDHERFSGCLKVTLDEILIALRDEVLLLRDPGKFSAECRNWTWMSEGPTEDALGRVMTEVDAELKRIGPRDNLYPEGFSAARFAEVIESERVWALLDEDELIQGP